MNYFLGIDIGTTHSKAVVITTGGEAFFETKRNYDILRPKPGYEEQDADEILQAVTGIMKEAVANIPPGGKVAAVSFSAAMHSVLPVDEKGNALYPAIIWADTRSKKEAEQIAKEKCASAIVANTGIPVHPMSPLCKILWFKNQQPALFKKTYKFISIKEYIFSRLTGKYLVDHSIAASTGFFNIHEKKWDATALTTIGLTEEKLSTPVPTVHAEYGLTEAYTQLFGIDHTVPLVIGASDGCLANLGSGAVEHGETALTVGTSGAVRMTVKKMPARTNGHLFIYPVTNDIYVRGGAINNGGIILKWLIDLFLPGSKQENDYEQILAMAQQADAGANNLLFLPYLLGERAPIWNADAKGVLFGLTMQHRKEHIVRAALEGICFTLFHIMKELEAEYGVVKAIFISGGFVQSPFWIQLLADISGKKLCVTEVTDASAMGAVYLAMLATGHLKDITEVKKFVHVAKVYEPVASTAANYQELFQLFIALYPKLKDSFVSLSNQ